jgi:hypothetical protein
VNRDLTGFQVDGFPSQPTHLAAADTGRQFQQKQGGEPVAPDGSQKGLDLLG